MTAILGIISSSVAEGAAPTVPATPTGLNSPAKTGTTIDLAWTDNAVDEDSYHVERSPDGSTGWVEVAGTLPANTTTYQDTGLTEGTSYWYRVFARNVSGDSNYSNELNVITDVTVSAVGKYDFAQNWSAALSAAVTAGPAITHTRASAAGGFDENGVYQKVGNNAHRFCHTFDGALWNPVGLYVERPAVNVCLDSENLLEGGSAWNDSNCKSTVGLAGAPDGTSTVSRIYADATETNRRRMFQTMDNATQGAQCTISVFVKRETNYDYFYIRAYTWGGNSGSSTDTFFDIRPGQGAPLGAGNYTLGHGVEDWDNGWYRLWMTVEGTAGTTTPLINFGPTSSPTNSTGAASVNDSVLVWGVQYEENDTIGGRTSYIPTTTSTATRATDDYYVDPSGILNPLAGTFYTRSRIGPLFTSSANIARMRDDATGDEVVVHDWPSPSQPRFIVEDNDVQQASLTHSGASGDTRVASGYQLDDFASSMDGGAVLTDNAGTIPTGMDKIYFGGDDDTRRLNGYLTEFRYFNGRLSNAELQALSLDGTEP